jgi:hypothetical protein
MRSTLGDLTPLDWKGFRVGAGYGALASGGNCGIHGGDGCVERVSGRPRDVSGHKVGVVSCRGDV